MTTLREVALSACAALWGLAVAIALLALWSSRPAPPGQPAGFATMHGFDARASFLFIAGVVLLPIAFTFALRPLIRRLGNGWPSNAAAAAMLVPIWFVLITKDLAWVLLPTALVLAVCFALRNFDPRFTRHDAVLLPTTLTTFIALIDLTHLSVDRALIVATLLVLAVRLLLPATRYPLPAAFAFTFAPLALALQTNIFSRDQRHMGWPSLLIALGTPFVVPFVLRNARTAARILAFVVYPIAVFSYGNAISFETAEGKPKVNFFEDGHSLLPASEMLRGERPYRDILPGHGLIEDGLLDYVAMRMRGETVGDALRGRRLFGGLTAIGVYAIAFAATGVPEVGLIAYFIGSLFGTHMASPRLVPPLIVLALLAAALRLRRPRLFGFAGAAVVFAGLTSLDFAAYSFVVVLLALARFPLRRDALRFAVIGIVVPLVLLLVVLALFGIADDFVHGTLVEVLTLGPVYSLTPFHAPPALDRDFPEVIAALFDKTTGLYILWIAVLLFLAVALTRPRSRRLDPLVVVAAFIAVCAISYAERHHLHFRFVLPSLVAAALFVAARRRAWVTPVALLLILMIGQLTTHIAIAGWSRRTFGPEDPTVTEIAELPRARGAYFHAADAAIVRSFARYPLAPDETFFDFTNRGILYFLFDRDCPIRQYEVAFFQTERLQREVIAALERNPRVVAALVPAHPTAASVDDVPNAVRAPLVWQWLQTHFEPAFAEGEVVVWRRK